MAKSAEENVPHSMRPIYDEITQLTDAFCRDHLDEEIAMLCHKVAGALARKRPSPLERGKRQVWACAILYALAQINFLFDRSETPHTTPGEIAAAFGVSQSTAGTKAKQIRDLLNVTILDPEWSRPSKIDENPMAWMISVNGLILDARYAPREIQEEAYRKGLIPYLPGHPNS